MAAIQRFRSAFHGFNREDVVHYIEYLNNQHKSQIEQLQAQLKAVEARTNQTDIQAQLDAALEKCARLEAQLAEAPANATAQELEAYRRAERTERLANERAQQIFTQANAVLADAAVKAERAAANIGVIADQATAQLRQCQESIVVTKEAFQEAVDSLYAIRPEI